MTTTEYRAHFSLWAILAAPLIAGNDVRTMSPETRAILTNREVIAVDQDPAGKPAAAISGANADLVVLARPLHDGSYAVGLFNRTAEPQSISLEWRALGLAGRTLHGRDLWKHADVPLSGESYTAVVPPHGVVLLKVS